MTAEKSKFIWLKQGALAAFAFLILFYNLIPVSLTPDDLPKPDLLYCVIAAIIVRRPQIAPFWLVVAIFLTLDIFLQRPLGVWTLCMLLALEAVRARRYFIRSHLFSYEWVAVLLIYLVALIVFRFILTVSLVAMPPLSADVISFFTTVVLYPITVFGLATLFGLRRPNTGKRGETQ